MPFRDECLSTLAKASRSGVSEETRLDAARITGAGARSCGELGGGSSNIVGTKFRFAVANLARMACDPWRQVGIESKYAWERTKLYFRARQRTRVAKLLWTAAGHRRRCLTFLARFGTMERRIKSLFRA